MHEELKGLDWLFHEVQRRGLIQAAGVYAVICWFLVQLLATVAQNLELSDVVVRFGIALTFAGLPLVLGAAWLVGGAAEAEPQDTGGQRPAAPTHVGPPGGGPGRSSAAPDPASAGSAHAERRAGLAAARLPKLKMVVVAILGFFGGVLWAQRHYGLAFPGRGAEMALPADVPARSVAVLPFATVGGDPEDEYFSQGVSEEIRSALARVPELRIASRTSSLQYAEGGQGLREIGAALRVRSVLEGSVQRADERLRVTVRLVDVGSDRQVWAETFDRRLDLESIFAVEAEIARAVVRALAVELTADRGAISVSRPPVSLEAHDLYLLGLHRWNRRTGEELQRAAEFFRSAIERDPEYALAHAGLANTYVLLPLYAGVPMAEAMPEARATAERALALDSTLAEAHAALAFVQMAYDWDWEGAEARFKRAIELSPSYATAHQWYGVFLDATGRTAEGREHHLQALELDPLSLISNELLGIHYIFVPDYERALQQLRRALELQSDFPLGLHFLAVASLLAGRYDEGEEALRRWSELTRTPAQPWSAVVRGVRDAGQRDGAVRALEILDREGALQLGTRGAGGSPYFLAEYYALAGAGEEALAALERGFRVVDFLMFIVKADPTFVPLRDQPRFISILERMGLSATRGAGQPERGSAP